MATMGTRTRLNVVFITSLPALFKFGFKLNAGHVNQIFLTLTPIICGPSVWDLLHVMLLEHRIFF